MAHPECTEPVKAVGDQILSTGGMLKFVKSSKESKFIVATETGIIHALKKENPQKEFFAATQRAICPNMKRITLEKVAWALEDMQYKITVPKEIADKARKAIERMLEVKPK
jgi:quinolinate synthase